MAHSPGPWIAVRGQGSHHRDWYIRQGDRRPDGTWPAVAKCHSNAIGARVVAEANARLIETAPDMLETLRYIVDRGIVSTYNHPDVFSRVQSVINQAEGK